MTYYSGFEPYVTMERNEGIRREVQTLRLERRLRQNGEPRSGTRLVALVSKARFRSCAGQGSRGNALTARAIATITGNQWIFQTEAPVKQKQRIN
jgi:hypothetical protein